MLQIEAASWSIGPVAWTNESVSLCSCLQEFEVLSML